MQPNVSNLTQSQLLIWTGQLLNPTAPLYNMALAFQLKGAIDAPAFQQAFAALVAGTDALRTVFESQQDVPQQRVLSQLPYTVEVLDWSQDTTAETRLNTWATERSEGVFDLSQRLFDCVLIKLASDCYVWYFNQHHLITDGWSVTVLYKQMAALYSASCAGTMQDVSNLPTYAGYRTYEAESRNKPGNDFWEKQLPAMPVAPSLYGYPAAGAGSANHRHTLELDVERSNSLRALTDEPDIRAWTQHMALFNVFATVLLAFLHRVSGQQKLAIGTPAHNRLTPDFKQTAGLFIELFPLVAQVEAGASFTDLFACVQQAAFDFLKHAKPGAATAELSRDFNVVLNYINAAFSDFAGTEMTSDWVHPNHVDPGHVLRLQVHDFDATGSITLHFDLNTTVFPAALRANIPTHFLRLLDAFIADRTQPIQAPALVQQAALPVLPSFADGRNAIQQFEAQVASNSAAVAVIDGSSQLSFAELNARANQLAHLLTSRNVGPGQRVAIHLKRSSELLISVLAVLKTGAAYIPLDTNNSATRTNAMLADAEAAALITKEALLHKLQPEGSTPLVLWDALPAQLDALSSENTAAQYDSAALAYVMYTSGSSGLPKGVMISHGNLAHYLSYAAHTYQTSESLVVPLFSAIGFDLTVTSLFLPLITGGTSVIFPEPDSGPDLAIFDALNDNRSNIIKLTPSHLELLAGADLSASRLQLMIVGGEDFKTELARTIQSQVGDQLRIYNEYGPTEATVGCVVQQFSATDTIQSSVPIGRAIPGIATYVLDEALHQVPQGVAGELYLAGDGVAAGYWQQSELTEHAFVANPLEPGSLLYRTGDLVRTNQEGTLEYLGRIDEQVKIAGRRIELGEIEHVLRTHPAIDAGIVDLRTSVRTQASSEECNCSRCGLPSNYPNADLDDNNVCSLCRSFEGYQNRVQKYFKTLGDLKARFAARPRPNEATYDCIALLSGGKDSTYVLARLVELGIKPLAFTLDNGYISEQAKDNIRRIVTDLGVDHVFGTTPAMNEIFVDSLQRHCNVCDGCFKTIYTLSMQLALEKEIPFIVTGLSRGQFFETRLTEELFSGDEGDLARIDEIILNARKVYHRTDDAVKRLIDVSAFENDAVFDQVEFLDFYRYTDVSLDEMLAFLDKSVSWVRPTDTGRSTNCLINQAGIFVHKKERGYSNYSFPYSWDVRLGHKERDAALEEINEEIDEPEVHRILDEIGYTKAQEVASTPQLVAYYVAEAVADERELRDYMSSRLPDYMVPVQFIRLDAFPVTANGKVDKTALPLPENVRPVTDVGYVAPRSDIEEMLVGIWSEVLNIETIGIYDRFLELGGSSLAAIRIITRANEAFQLDLPLNLAFNKPTIAAFAEYVRDTIMQLLEQLDAE